MIIPRKDLTTKNRETRSTIRGLPSLKLNWKTKTVAMYLLIFPFFICRGSGTVVIAIEIDEYGEVKRTQVLEAHASIDRDCMTEEALRAAKSSIFSIKKGSKTTKGKITYQFIEQN